MVSESRIQAEVRAVLSQRDATTRCWRNMVGAGMIHGAYMTFGLGVGSADLVGIHKALITPEMVGSYIGRFFAVEVKTPKGRLSDEQKAWAKTIQSFGGIVEVCRSKEDAEDLLKRLG